MKLHSFSLLVIMESVVVTALQNYCYVISIEIQKQYSSRYSTL